MLSVSEARERILAVFLPVESQTVSLNRAAGRVLACDIAAETDLPLFDNSSVDGFALHKADFACLRTLNVVADIRAGETSETPIRPGQSARIMTGAPLPPGAEAVVMVEDTDFNVRTPGTPAPQTVTIHKSVRPGENIRRRGDDLHTGDEVLSAGMRLRAQEIGLLAMLGAAEVLVYRQPRFALLSSGDELLSVEAPLTPGKIHESNSYALAALAEAAGVELIRLGVAADTEADVRSRLERAVEAKADVIVSSAGVSVGAFDYVKYVIEEDGELDFWKVNMRPGKPLAFGKYRGVPFFGLPGNPVSAFVGFEVFVRPALEKLSGLELRPRPHQMARLAESLESDGRESYLRAVISQENGVLVARLTGHQGSGNIFSLVRANALLIVPSGVKSLPANSDVEIWPIA
ncbi:MAG: molybdopterin molybdotransferase MoeA [Candidatus Atribacteria bacterium]|nr:molybdopterin molybdotransferase MoeA [Candidatus Atribacteria bacterium]